MFFVCGQTIFWYGDFYTACHAYTFVTIKCMCCWGRNIEVGLGQYHECRLFGSSGHQRSSSRGIGMEMFMCSLGGNPINCDVSVWIDDGDGKLKIIFMLPEINSARNMDTKSLLLIIMLYKACNGFFCGQHKRREMFLSWRLWRMMWKTRSVMWWLKLYHHICSINVHTYHLNTYINISVLTSVLSSNFAHRLKWLSGDPIIFALDHL